MRNKRNYLVDPTVEKSGRGGVPPEGHERRCQAKGKAHQLQCKNWAMVGTHLCRFHGGKNHGESTVNMKKSRYAHLVGGTLADRLNELANQDEAERFDLSGEVDLGETTLEKALITFDLVCQQGKLDKVDEATGVVTQNFKARALAQQAMKDAIDFVRTLRIDHAKISLLSKEKLSANNINWFVAHITRIFGEVLAMSTALNANPAEAQSLAVQFAQKVAEIKTLNSGDGLPNVVIKIE